MTSKRRVGFIGATGIGVGSMLGAGVFSGMWTAVLDAGRWYLVAVLLAGAIAVANALSTAQLAARHPVAGGAYAYGRIELSPVAGHIAGAAFVVGKTVSVAVGALVLGAYVIPGHAQAVATAAVALCWALNSRGITKTAAGAAVVAVTVSLALAALVGAALVSSASFGWFEVLDADPLQTAQSSSRMPPLLTGAAAAFFAFAGYARIATLGEEVRDPARTIPRAIIAALGWTLVIYLGVAFALNRAVTTMRPVDLEPAVWRGGTGAAAPATPPWSVAPLEFLARVAGFPVWVVTAAAILAVAGAMLAVMAGAGRTAMAMAREGDLPRLLAHQGASGAPWRAEAAVAVAAIALVWIQGANLVLVSAASILLYYSVANLAAVRQRRAGRTATLRVPVTVSVVGLLGCVLLAGVALAASSAALAPAVAITALVLGWPSVTWAVRRSRSR